MMIQRTAAMVLISAASALACVHPPASYKGSFAETSQQAMIFYRNGHEDLVLKLEYEFSASTGLPSDFGWVIPVPAKPDDYGLTEGKVFEDAFKLMQRHERQGKGDIYKQSLARVEADPDTDVKVVDHQIVGEYDITALKTTGKAAGASLNTWLLDHGYNEMKADSLKYYTDMDWTFLAIRVDHNKGSKEIAKTGELHALRISVAADQIFYPLKFSAQSDTMNVSVYLFTEQKVKMPTWLGERDFTVWTYDMNKQKFGTVAVGEMPADLGELAKLRAEVEKGKTGKFESLYFTALTGLEINSRKKPLSDWKSDFMFKEEPLPAD